MKLDVRDLEQLFADCFLGEFRTQLEGGGLEPLYFPSADPEKSPHRIVYREDYFASALHEVAHWCLAGERRRTLEDYGYWYAGDGRTDDEQIEFERVEARPQALEWIFSEVCGVDFNLSADNLAAGLAPSDAFAGAVDAHRRRYLDHGLPSRAACFLSALRGAVALRERRRE